MSGHNKWSTIKHKKGKADAARGRLFTRLIKEITVAARMGGGSEDSNARLRTAVATAKANNMPLDNITRAIKKGTGELEGVSYEDATYEGYGPEGVAILVDCVTDNRNRTVSEVRHLFTKYAGKLAEPGAVAWQFTERGRAVVKAQESDEDTLMMAVMEVGADDLVYDEGTFEVFAAPESLNDVIKACEEAGFEVAESGTIKQASNTVKVEGKGAQTLLKLLDLLEDLDDVQAVWANFEMDDDLLESMS
jgi:YebC/PmpR family DNA-binding regulatory protein